MGASGALYILADFGSKSEKSESNLPIKSYGSDSGKCLGSALVSDDLVVN